MKRIILALALVPAAACAPVTKANERGGVISWYVGTSSDDINVLVEQHCARYGRRPSVQPNAISAGPWSYQFECVPR